MIPKSDFKLGQTVREQTSGITGTLTSVTMTENGMLRFCIQPPSDNNAFKDGILVDEVVMKRIDGGYADSLPPLEDAPYGIYQKVRDKISGYVGRVVNITWFSNGCLHYDVVAEGLHPKNGTPVSHYFTVDRLEPVVEETKTVAAPEKPKGGPIQRMKNIR